MAMSSRIREIPSTKIGDAVAEYHIWDIARLQNLYASKTGKEDIIIDLKEFSESGIPCLQAGSNEEYTAIFQATYWPTYITHMEAVCWKAMCVPSSLQKEKSIREFEILF